MATTNGWTGWVVLAAVLMIITGFFQFIYGLGAIFHAHWYIYANGAAYVLNVATWGWWLLIVGLVLLISGVLLWQGNLFGRIVGLIFAILSLLANIGNIEIAPVWSIIAIIVDAVIIYAIAAHGGEMKTQMHR